jgi:predicted component of type VI protein secretion system
MAEIEHPERYSWWLNALSSLGISTLDKYGLSNHKEASDLKEAVKQTLYEDFLEAYSESNL